MSRSIGLTLVALSLTLPAAVLAQEPADLIVVGGTIHTLDPAAPQVEAMAVADGRVVALGASRDLLDRHRGQVTEVLELGGRTVVPGLIDAHGHVMDLGRFLRSLDLRGTGSPNEIADQVREAAATRPAGAWILGRGWDQNDWTVKEFPTREVLDEAAPDHPVVLERVDGHAVWVNSAALETAGVTAETPDPEGGRIVREADGSPSGVLVDNAEALVKSRVPAPDAAESAARLAVARHHLLSVGLTGVHDMGAGPATVELYRAAADSGRLLPRLVVYLEGNLATLDWWETEGAEAVGRGDGERWLVRGVKLYADGALGSRGAALLEPYSDDAGNRGLLVTPPDSLAERTARTVALGLQPAIHAIGDRGNRVALEAIAAAGTDATQLRPRIEHAQVIALEDVPRFAALEVLASVQPTHATSDMPWAEDRVGPERIRGAYAWRTLREAGVRLACGSDFPVEQTNPFHGLYAAVTRMDREGRPAGGWRAAERMTREEALACFTVDAAYAAGLEDELGSLAVGRRADFLVLDRDVLAVPEEEIAGTRVLRTVIGGETVYEAEGYSRGSASRAAVASSQRPRR